MKFKHLYSPFLIIFTFFVLLTAILWSTASAQDPTPTAGHEPTPLPTETAMESVSGLSAVGTSGCNENECIFYPENGTDDAGSIIPYPPVGSCYYSTSANEIYIGECPDGQPIISGFRFPNVSIPEGTRIAYAYLEFTVDGPYSNNLLVDIYGEASSNPQPFGASPYKPEDRALTTEKVPWDIPSTDLWQLSQSRRTPDITPILIELVEHDWQNGNSIAFIFQSVALGNGSDLDPANRHRRVIGIERPPETYIGDVARLVIVLATHPPSSISRYWNTWSWSDRGIRLEWNSLRNAGCQTAKENEDVVVLLDFGNPERLNGVLGTNLPQTNVFAPIEKIKIAVQEYIRGYWKCSTYYQDAYLTIGVGTNNTGIAGFYIDPASDHGTAWGEMIENLNDWLIHAKCVADEFSYTCNWRRQVAVVGAIDIEDWGNIYNFTTGELEQVKPEGARAWAAAYSLAAPTKKYINYGTCENCATACGSADYPWCRDHYWYLAWGNSNAWPLPEIYREDGTNAGQWEGLSKYSATCVNCEPESTPFHTQIFFLGSLTQEGACKLRNCLPGTENSPQNGWEQLFDALFGDPDTRQIVLPWSTDILWQADLKE